MFSTVSENQALLAVLSNNDTSSSFIRVLIIGQLFSITNTNVTELHSCWTGMHCSAVILLRSESGNSRRALDLWQRHLILMAYTQLDKHQNNTDHQLYQAFCMLSSAVLHPGRLIPNTRLQATSFVQIWIVKEVFSLHMKTSTLCMLSLLSDYSCMTVHK